LERSSGKVLDWRPGEREAGGFQPPLLGPRDLEALHRALHRVEDFFGWAPDIEWTGQANRLTLLQARPITTSASDQAAASAGPESEGEDKRSWYLSLRPGRQRLHALRQRVTGELIPQLAAQGRRFAEQAIEDLNDDRLARALDERREALETWRKIYWDEFIPFAHGVRQLATYYNDAVRPVDPYEFVGLLEGERMLAAQRNRALGDLAAQLVENAPLWEALREIAAREPGTDPTIPTADALDRLQDLPGGAAFLTTWNRLQDSLMDVAYEGQRLSRRPDLLLSTLDELARARQKSAEQNSDPSRPGAPSVRDLEKRLWAAVGPDRRAEAEEVLATARVSWRLRDDDNLLLGRVESQLLRAIRVGAERLRAAGRLEHAGRVAEAAAPIVSQALRDPHGEPVTLPEPKEEPSQASPDKEGASPRQLVGQPASPGMASGRARCVRSLEDLGAFSAGEVLVCDAIQPTMTHLVPLACAVVERRGGMLIHGAIIARELGIPCVNGIPRATEVLRDGELLTVDGYLGIVTVGAPEFDLEARGDGP
jgi:pyruvate,water dikinase